MACFLSSTPHTLVCGVLFIHRLSVVLSSVEETTGWIKCRTVLGIMGFLGFANVYAMRVNLSVAIVAMINSTAPVPSNDSTLDVCPAAPASNTTVPPVSYYEWFNNLSTCWKLYPLLIFVILFQTPGDFNWSAEQQSIILGSFFYGYVLTQVNIDFFFSILFFMQV